jgi:hypothetical protein
VIRAIDPRTRAVTTVAGVPRRPG